MFNAANPVEVQIHDKEYALKFKRSGKRVVLLGVNFDFATGQITDSVSEEVQ